MAVMPLPPPLFQKVVGYHGKFGRIHVVGDHFWEDGCR
jgi:hypothetical protein